MTDLDLILSPAELDQLRAGYKLRLSPSLVAPPPVTAGRHYPHARFAQLCYFGNPLGTFEQQLLNNSIDLVVCGGEAGLMAKLGIEAPPATPIVLYTNVSNIYQDLLTDWYAYADARQLDRESAFLHLKGGFGNRLFYNNDAARPLTNPQGKGFSDWAVDYHARFLAANPRANGLFVDNSVGAPPTADPSKVAEDVTGYAAAYAAILGRLKNLGLVIPNTGGATITAIDLMVAACGWWFQEFLIRPLAHNWKQFEDAANLLAGRLALPGNAILDSHPSGGAPLDPRTQLATLAYYYLLADPDRTYLDFFGGFAPGTPWSEHWCAAAGVDVGRPSGDWKCVQSGPDPADSQANHRVYGRVYSRADVLYRPLSFRDWSTHADLSDASAVIVPVISGKPLAADGSIGAAVTSVRLRNGEGAILLN